MAYLKHYQESESFSSDPYLVPLEQAPAHRPNTRSTGKRFFQKKRGRRADMLIGLLINAALLFGLVQCLRVLITDTFRVSNLIVSQHTVQHLYTESRQDHQVLSSKIKRYASPSGVEELARNYLNMVGDDELPVRFQ